MLKKHSALLTLSSIKLIILIALFWMAFANISFFTALLQDYPLNGKNAVFLATLVFGFTAVIITVLSLLCFRITTKPVVIVLLIASSMAAYFMDTYHILIDSAMVRNTMETDTHEAGDLISAGMFGYLLLLGIVPAIVVWRAKILFKPFRREVLLRAKLVGVLALTLLVLLFVQSAATASFFREHKAIRLYSNPANYMFAMGRYVQYQLHAIPANDQPVTALGEDAKIPDTDNRRDLVIMVVGETARADRFSLNGYRKHTNPLLEKQDVVSFSNVTSCATSTAISVPCMFSAKGETSFNVDKAGREENVLDMLQRSGAHVLWRENNSSAKGVADRVTYQRYLSAKTNTICNPECRDEGMLVGLQDYIDKQPSGDIVIVLHQMGNHGPAYYKRYPKEFEVFTPTCQTNDLAACSSEEIDNAYDNAILYTDYFLNHVIALLKKYDGKFDVSMLYVSDHGESLGENNVYLHGLPNFIAPKTQRHVPMIMWIGKHFDGLTMAELRAKKDMPLSHDNITHTLLGLLEVESNTYNRALDLRNN